MIVLNKTIYVLIIRIPWPRNSDKSDNISPNYNVKKIPEKGNLQGEIMGGNYEGKLTLPSMSLRRGLGRHPPRHHTPET